MPFCFVRAAFYHLAPVQLDYGPWKASEGLPSVTRMVYPWLLRWMPPFRGNPWLARGTCRDPAWCNTCNNPNGVWCKTNAFFLGQEGLAGTRDRGIFWEQRDPQGPAGTWTRVTLAMTRGNGDPRCVFLGGKRDPRAPRWWYSMGKRGTQVKVRRDARLQESESSRRLAVSRL